MPKQTKMKYRGPVSVFFLPYFTFGIYAIYWLASTRGEMKRLGAKIPTTWLYIIPFVGIWWLWKYSEGVEEITDSGLSTVAAFLLLLLLGNIGMAVIQNTFNTHEAASQPQPLPAPTPVDPATQLQRLHALKQRGAITPEEYDAKKKQLLGL